MEETHDFPTRPVELFVSRSIQQTHGRIVGVFRDYFQNVYLSGGPHYVNYVDGGEAHGWHSSRFDVTGPNYVGGSYQASGIGDGKTGPLPWISTAVRG